MEKEGEPTHNRHASFVGYEVMKAKQREQLNKFRQWTKEDRYGTFHHSHFDWWMFPINLSSSHGLVRNELSGPKELASPLS